MDYVNKMGLKLMKIRSMESDPIDPSAKDWAPLSAITEGQQWRL